MPFETKASDNRVSGVAILVNRKRLFWFQIPDDFTQPWITPGQKQSLILFQDGLLQRFGIEGMVFELNANWIGSLNKMPSEYDWMEFGKNLNEVFSKYLKAKR